MDEDKPTLDEQIAEVRRELALRQKVYPGWTASGRMKADQAAKSMARMQAVHDTLVQVQLRGLGEPVVHVRVVGPNGEPLP